LKLPSRDDIVGLNRDHIARSGGTFVGSDNLINEDSLEWVLATIQHPLFGYDLYPTLVEKAAGLAWTIIRRHVFFDGNKRTGISACQALLRMNGYRLRVESQELVAVALEVATSEESLGFADFTEWIGDRIERVGDEATRWSSSTR
jgi:death-on-curing protein